MRPLVIHGSSMASVCKVVTTLDGRVHRVAQHIVVFVALRTRAGRATCARRLLVFAARDQILLGVSSLLIYCWCGGSSISVMKA